MNQFSETTYWRKRQILNSKVAEVEDLTLSLVGTCERKEFTRDNFNYILNQLELKTKALNKFYKANK